MPSVDPLRVPLAGASPLARRGRCARWRPPRWREGARNIAVPGSMGRTPPSEGHGIRRVVTVVRPRFRRDSVLPSSMRAFEHPLSSSPGQFRGWSPGSPAGDDRDCLLFRAPAKEPGCSTARVLGSLRKFVNRARDRSRCSSDRSEGHAAREAGFAIRQTSAFDNHRYAPLPDGRSAPFVARSVSARELLTEP
jgi:hypothetical protein